MSVIEGFHCTDLMELDNPSLTLEGPSLTLDDPSPIESAMQYTRSRYHAGSNSMRVRNTHYVIYFATFYLLFLFSNSCPIILKIIPEYLAQAYHQPYGATSPTALSCLSRWALTNISNHCFHCLRFFDRFPCKI